MLKILTEGKEFDTPCVLLLGGFDGIHKGHETLLAAAKKYNLPVGLTSISGCKEGGDIFTFPEREFVYEREGFSFALQFPFTEEFRSTAAEDFLKGLFSKINLKAVVCGEDFRFGKGAAGTPALLKELAPCPVTVLPVLTQGGEKVSSTAVKTALSRGDMEIANSLLCGGYFLQGIVEHGRQEGRKYGFPTLNLTFPAEKFPLLEGVYGGYAEVEEGRYPAIINVGARPTFHVEEKKTEAFLDGFSFDEYGKIARIYPTSFYRPISDFKSPDALKGQLQRDIARLRQENK